MVIYNHNLITAQGHRGMPTGFFWINSEPCQSMVPTNRNDRLRSLRVRSTEPDSTNGRECEVVRSLEKTGSRRELNDITLATARSAKHERLPPRKPSAKRTESRGDTRRARVCCSPDWGSKGHARSAWATEPRQRSPEKVEKNKKTILKKSLFHKGKRHF